jgi:hypothetical protein
MREQLIKSLVTNFEKMLDYEISVEGTISEYESMELYRLVYQSIRRKTLYGGENVKQEK